MASVSSFDVFYIVFCHERAKRLHQALYHILEEVPTSGVTTAVVLVPDRPTRDVEWVVDKWAADPRVIVAPCPFPITSPEGGQRWTEARNFAADTFSASGHTARWCANFDDDWLYCPGWETTLKKCLARRDVWSWRIVSLVLWDGCYLVNAKQHHNSPHFGRWEPGWRRDERLTDHIADEVKAHLALHTEAERTLPFYLLDRGTITPAERVRLFQKYARTGKCDAYTMRYLEDPHILKIDDVFTKYNSPEEYYAWQIANYPWR